MLQNSKGDKKEIKKEAILNPFCYQTEWVME